MVGEIMTNAQLRLEVASLTNDLRRMEVERDQARGGIEETLKQTECPSLVVLIEFFRYYSKSSVRYRAVIEKLKPHLDKLPQDLALEFKAEIGQSPDATETDEDSSGG